MSALGEVLGGTHPFEYRGTTYAVQMVSQDAKLAFARRLFQRARDAARELRPCMDREEYQAHLKALNDAYLAGEYDFESPRGQAALKTTSGMLSLCALLWQVDEHEMMLILKARPAEVSALLAVILRESFEIEEEQCPTPDGSPSAPASRPSSTTSS